MIFCTDNNRKLTGQFILIYFVLGALAFTGCTSGKLKSESKSNTAANDRDKDRDSVQKSAVTSSDLPVRSASRSDTRYDSKGTLVVQGVKLEHTDFDFPITINSRVEFWVDYFTNRGRKHFVKYLERSELFVPYIHPILKQNGMPEDLVYLAMIESGFNNHARSTAKAVGPWQFISATGKRYGLMVNWWVDERRDTRKATLAAVEYLRDLYTMFQSWELAAASYNAGEAKIARAIRRYGTKDFWAISRQKFLRQETRDYVPKIIAAALVAKNRTQFGFPASTLKAGAGEVIAGDGEVVKLQKESEVAVTTSALDDEDDSVASILGADEIADENGAKDAVASLVTRDDTNGGQPLAKPVPTPYLSKKGELSGEELSEFEVQSPADLLKVARAAGLSYQTVKGLNPELMRWCTPPHIATFRLKLPTLVKDRFIQSYNHVNFPRQVHFLAYKAKKGDTLLKVAKHFGLKPDPIADLNGISPKQPVRAGSKIFLPMPNDRSRSLASLEVLDPPERRKLARKNGRKRYRVSLKKREAARAAPRKEGT